MRVAGKNPSGEFLEKVIQSPNYKKTGFENLSFTPMKADDTSYWSMLREFFKKNPDKVPAGPIPSVKTHWNLSARDPFLVWFGHSSYFLRIEGANFLVDPVFSGYASPIASMVKAFKGADVYTAADMPTIDYLILTHDHYDHLDYKTLLQLKEKVARVYCSLGVGSHLRYWGYDPVRITELDWWQSESLSKNLQLTAAPARHFSGRGIKRFQTLWSSFILQTSSYTCYLGGDSGYDNHFKDIGDKFGPFDIALLECGQYNDMWPDIHMMPEQTVQAAIDLNAKVLMPVHWGKFSLAMHSWNEPIRRAYMKAEELKVNIQVPRIGKPFWPRDEQFGTEEKWWEF